MRKLCRINGSGPVFWDTVFININVKDWFSYWYHSMSSARFTVNCTMHICCLLDTVTLTNTVIWFTKICFHYRNSKHWVLCKRVEFVHCKTRIATTLKCAIAAVKANCSINVNISMLSVLRTNIQIFNSSVVTDIDRIFRLFYYPSSVAGGERVLFLNTSCVRLWVCP